MSEIGRKFRAVGGISGAVALLLDCFMIVLSAHHHLI